MPATTRSDIVIPELLVEAVRGAFAGMQALNGTPAAIVKTGLPGDKRGGDKVEIPYFGTLGELEDIAEGEPLTITKLSATKEEALVQRAGKAFETTHWARLASRPEDDPYEEAARQIVEATQRRADKALIDAAVAAGADLLVHDVTAAAGGANKFTYDVMVDAKMKWGDEQDDIVLIGMHSATYGQLLKLKDTTGRPLLTDPVADGQLPRFTGIPVKVSDRFPVDGDTYTTLLFKRGAVVFWFNENPRIETDREPRTDTDLLVTNIYFAAHRYKRLPGATKSGVVAIKHKK